MHVGKRLSEVLGDALGERGFGEPDRLGDGGERRRPVARRADGAKCLMWWSIFAKNRIHLANGMA